MKLCVRRPLMLSDVDWLVVTSWKLREVPGRFAAGMYASSALADELMREAGIWLPGNGCPVVGSINVTPDAEKSPARIAAVGTVAY